jgi:hypothetical protein
VTDADPRPRGRIRWVVAFLDNASDEVAATNAFWQAATATTLSPVRGPEGQFATLQPAEGDAWLKVQRLDGPPAGGRVHVDLAVDGGRAGLRTAVGRAAGLGAVVDTELDTVVVLRSPGGFPFCLTDWDASGRPARQVRTGSRLLDQVCVDIPVDRFDAEVAFWAGLTGWQVRGAGDDDEFVALVRPADIPVKLLLQRLDDETGPVTGHLDFASEVRDEEVAALVALGAREGERSSGWTVMRDPAGRVFCVTDRKPATGVGA